MPTCKTCGKECENFPELARHIISQKSTHKYSVKWALKFIANTQYLDKKVSQQSMDRIPLTEEQREAKQDARRILSGIEKTTLCVCPHCNSKFPERIPVEFLQSNTAWRKGTSPIVFCNSCRK